MAPHETYKATGDDDKWVSIAAGSEKEWRALCEVMGKPSLADDPRFATAAKRKENEAALDDTITAWTRERDRWEITEALQKAGVAAFPSMSNRDLGEDRHLDERGYLVQLEHPVVGRRIHAGIPWKMSGTPAEVRHAAPLAGADTDEVFERCSVSHSRKSTSCARRKSSSSETTGRRIAARMLFGKAARYFGAPPLL